MVVMETEGAKCFHDALSSGKVVTLDAIRSVALSLGSRSIQKELLEMAQSTDYEVISGVVTDKVAVEACLKFADDHRMLVEPACGAGLSSVYSRTFVGGDPLQFISEDNQKPIIVVVCGGDMVSLALLLYWKDQFSL